MLETKDPAETLLPEPAEAAGTQIAQYVLGREIGRGAMSVVYEARDTRAGQDVALKVLALPASLTAEEVGNLAARFERGARTVARLSHPKVVSVHEIGADQGQHFLAMEYLRGQTLRERMNGGVTPRETCLLLAQIAEALDAVHAAGIVHGDVKPSNIMLLPDGTVKLLDFGMAQSSEDGAVTDAGIIVGAPSCMAPEQVKGQRRTAATDIWALGILSYEMLTGRLPFTGQTAGSVLYQIVHQSPAPTPLPAGVQKVLLGALDKLPIQRYPTASAFVQALQSALVEQPAAPQPAAPHPVTPAPIAPAPIAPAPIAPEAEAYHPKAPADVRRVTPSVSRSLSAPPWLPGAALALLFLLGFCGTFFARHPTAHALQKEAAQKEAAGQKLAQKAAEVPIQKPASPPGVQASRPARVQASQPAALLLPQSAAPPFGPLKVQITPRRHSAASMPAAPLTAETLPQRREPLALPVQVSRPAAILKRAAMHPGPAEIAARPVPAPIAAQKAPAPLAARPVPARAASVKTASRPPVQSAAEPAQDAAQQDADQGVALPAGGDGYDPEAAARLRKSAWSQSEAAGAP